MLAIIGTWALGGLVGVSAIALVSAAALWILEWFEMLTERVAESVVLTCSATLALGSAVAVSYGFYRLGDLILGVIS